MSENHFVLDEPMDQGAVIRIIGIGTTGLRSVSKMAGRIHNVECMGVLPASECSSDTKPLQIVFISSGNNENTPDFEPLLKIINSSDLTFLVTDLNEGHNGMIPEIFAAAHSRVSPLILVVPAPNNGTGRPAPPLQLVSGIRAAVDGMILVSRESLSPLDPYAPKVFDDTAMHDYLIRHAIEKATDIITTRSLMCVDLADVLCILKGPGMIRCGIGIASGTGRGASATDKAVSALKRQGATPLAKTPRLLCCITGSDEMTMHDYNDVNELLHRSVNEETNIRIAVTRHDEMGNNLMVTIWTVEICKCS